jgi:hypothetical protein
MIGEFASALPWAFGALWVTALAAAFAILGGIMVRARKLYCLGRRRFSDKYFDKYFGFRVAKVPATRRSGMRRRVTDR